MALLAAAHRDELREDALVLLEHMRGRVGALEVVAGRRAEALRQCKPSVKRRSISAASRLRRPDSAAVRRRAPRRRSPPSARRAPRPAGRRWACLRRAEVFTSTRARSNQGSTSASGRKPVNSRFGSVAASRRMRLEEGACRRRPGRRSSRSAAAAGAARARAAARGRLLTCSVPTHSTRSRSPFRRRGGRLVAARDQRRVPAEVLAQRLQLRGVLHHDAVHPPRCRGR